MYLAGYNERLGTGILDMVDICKKAGLKEPEFKIEDVFKIILWRNEEAALEFTGQVTPQVTPQAQCCQVKRIFQIIRSSMSPLRGFIVRYFVFFYNHVTPSAFIETELILK
jgi:predicted HTH transcriptional regulator